MNGRKEVSPVLVRELAGYAELALASGREEIIAATLEAWIKDANELSRRMSAVKYLEVAPATIFKHIHEIDESN